MNELGTAVSHGLMDGIALSAALGLVIVVSLYFNARLWLHDYPQPMQARVPPLTPRERQLRMVLGLVFFGVLVGGLALGVNALERALGGTISFLYAFIYCLLVLNLFNLFDAVVLDYLLLARMKPAFAILPGTEDLVGLFDDRRMHLVNCAKGLIFCLVGSLFVALLAAL